MIHARSDYNRIQDPAGKIGKDEPVFLLRAKDKIAAATVYHWADLLEDVGGDPELVEHVRAHAERMYDWGQENNMKLPDAPASTLK